MIVFGDPADVPAGFGPSVVVIGKFDGVHAGHRAVIERAMADAKAMDAAAVAVTFDRNPLAVLHPERCPESLVSLEHKLALLADTGLDAALVLRFDEALAALPPEQFVKTHLVDALHASRVLVGADFRYGHRGAGTVQTLLEQGAREGFTVEIVGDIREGETRVSSTYIRTLLAEGAVREAAQLLGRTPAVWGTVVHGLKRGRELGYPTANLGGVDGVVPGDGVYAGWLLVNGGEAGGDGIRYPAAISVGTNPTFGDVDARQVEAHVLSDAWLELYDRAVEVRFVERVRGMVAFDGVPALIEQMAADVDRVRELLAAEAAR